VPVRDARVKNNLKSGAISQRSSAEIHRIDLSQPLSRKDKQRLKLLLAKKREQADKKGQRLMRLKGKTIFTITKEKGVKGKVVLSNELKVITVDPAIGIENQKRLRKLMREKFKFLQARKIPANTPHSIGEGDAQEYVVLSNSILKSVDSNGKSSYEAVAKGEKAMLGEGAYGKVKGFSSKLRLLKSGGVKVKEPDEKYAGKEDMVVKVIKSEGEEFTERELKGLKQEVEIMKTMYPDTRPIFYVTNEERIRAKAYIIMPKMQGVGLDKLFDSDDFKKWNYEQRLELAISTAKEVKRFHDAGFIHRDIKPENLIYDPKTKQVRIIDFGCARHKNHPDENVVGTPIYMAPEIMEMKDSQKSDIYSLAGVMMTLFGADNIASNIKEGMGFIACLRASYDDSGLLQGLKLSDKKADELKGAINSMADTVDKRPDINKVNEFLSKEMKSLLEKPKKRAKPEAAPKEKTTKSRNTNLVRAVQGDLKQLKLKPGGRRSVRLRT